MDSGGVYDVGRMKLASTNIFIIRHYATTPHTTHDRQIAKSSNQAHEFLRDRLEEEKEKSTSVLR